MAEIIKHKKEAPLAGLVGMGGGLTGFGLVGPGVTPPGQANYADGHSGSYTWVCPPGVTSVSIVCIGGGAGGKGQLGRGGGGGVDLRAPSRVRQPRAIASAGAARQRSAAVRLAALAAWLH